ncbi:MAG: hypothetical protein HPY30_05480 [Gammaproteobacteria bacterium (ex Lamellibrachia satsuma)]|nr:MAG: hypothetical protein HPY30_05480 [Gammaproteobacteria bacterium (ex Lamellibrachia satsuma)]
MVYSRPGLSEPKQELDYLARYAHRTAISNPRLLLMTDGVIQFRSIFLVMKLLIL